MNDSFKNDILNQVNNKKLLATSSFIGGVHCNQNQEILEVYNPASDEVIANIKMLDEDEIRHAIKIADNAFAKWNNILPKERGKILLKWFQLVEDNKEDLAKIITLEQGKPLNQSLSEVIYANSFIEWFADESKRIHGDFYPINSWNSRSFGIKEPLGAHYTLNCNKVA